MTKLLRSQEQKIYFFLILADVRIFDNAYCHRVYDTIFDPTTEICAGDYDQRTDTMVNHFLFFISFKKTILEWRLRWSFTHA